MEEITISVSLFIGLAGMALFGLFMAGVALAVGITNLWHRDQMLKELRRYNSALSQTNEQNDFELVFPYNHDSPIASVGIKDYPDREFLEDRD